jgi:hypothetical protein
MYDEDGNLIEDLNLDNQDEEEIDTPDGHEQEDQGDDEEVVTISKSELEKLKKQNEKLKANKVKHIVKTKTQKDETLTKLQELEQRLLEKDRQDQEKEIKSLYEDADIDKVRDLTEKWLTVKQAINALYADEIKVNKSRWFVLGRSVSVGAKKEKPRGFDLWNKSTQQAWINKNQ